MTKKVNIYCPTYHRFEKTKRSILSTIDSIDISNHDVHFYIVDNNSPTEMKDWLANQSCDNVTVELLSENVGKGSAVNQIHKKARESDYVISIDSDLINKRGINWIDMLVDVMEQDKEWGLIACSQEGLNCHIVQSLSKVKKVGQYNIKYGSIGIGGGALIISSSDFTNVGGYTNQDIFIGDDGELMASVTHKLRKLCGVCEQSILYHPHPNEGLESEYQKWKSDKARRKIGWDKNPNTGFYERK